MSQDKANRRLKFYGLNDLSTFPEAKKVMDYLDSYTESKIAYTLVEIIELYNVLQFVENEVFPNNYSEEDRISYKALLPKLQKSISLFFRAIDESNIPSVVTEIDYNYRQDLLFLLTKHKVHERVPASSLLSAILNVNVSISNILENKEITNTFDEDVRLLIIADCKNAEVIVYKYLEARDRRVIHLPASLTTDDKHKLLYDYIDNDDANPNYIKLIADSRINSEAGIDAKLKLKAKRKRESWTEEFFKKNESAVAYGCEVRISEEQEESCIQTQDELQGELIIKYSYSKKWLDENSETPAKVIGNFINLFGFVNQQMILTVPSYESQLGIFERFIFIKGKDSYPAGAAFQSKEQTALLQTMIYERFLRSGENNIENVLAWFFRDYLKNQFQADGFKYMTSSKGSTYLEKSRNVFTEMESIIKQFTLYVDDGEIDQGLLAISSSPVRYSNIPSLALDKYAYATKNDDMLAVQHFMFSDQSGLGYINDSLNATNLFELLTNNKVRYDDFPDHDKPQINKLISLRVLEKVTEFVKFRNKYQVLALKNLFDVEALSYYHLPSDIQSEIDDMVEERWLTRKTSLLTEPEASYFNYFLNQKEFSDSHDLRNKYIHGSQGDKDDENTHYNTYIISLKLMMALVIKINSDFLLRNTPSMN